MGDCDGATQSEHRRWFPATRGTCRARLQKELSVKVKVKVKVKVSDFSKCSKLSAAGLPGEITFAYYTCHHHPYCAMHIELPVVMATRERTPAYLM